MIPPVPTNVIAPPASPRGIAPELATEEEALTFSIVLNAEEGDQQLAADLAFGDNRLIEDSDLITVPDDATVTGDAFDEPDLSNLADVSNDAGRIAAEVDVNIGLPSATTDRPVASETDTFIPPQSAPLHIEESRTSKSLGTDAPLAPPTPVAKQMAAPPVSPETRDDPAPSTLNEPRSPEPNLRGATRQPLALPQSAMAQSNTTGQAALTNVRVESPKNTPISMAVPASTTTGQTAAAARTAAVPPQLDRATKTLQGSPKPPTDVVALHNPEPRQTLKNDDVAWRPRGSAAGHYHFPAVTQTDTPLAVTATPPNVVTGPMQSDGRVPTGAEFADVTMRADVSAASTDRTASVTSIPGSPPAVDQARQIAQQLVTGMPQKAPGTAEITLQPEELGRVRMSLTLQDGVMAVAIQADRPETLDLMRRHIDQLEQTYRQMGFENMSFSFSGSNSQNQTGFGDSINFGDAPDDTDIALQHSTQSLSTDGRLDLRM